MMLINLMDQKSTELWCAIPADHASVWCCIGHGLIKGEVGENSDPCFVNVVYSVRHVSHDSKAL